MTRVVPIRFKYNPKTYWFTYEGSDPVPGDWVVVARENGKVFGWVEDDPFDIDEQCEKNLRAPLKPILRVADDADYAKLEELQAKGAEAKRTFRELATKRKLDIKPVDVEYMLDADRAIFHFSAEDRVDFRDLVRDLASTLHVRVDMRQIGVREEARLVGGLGHCGEMLCCVRMSSAFQPVSIRMAKDQDLPLNPTKVSGACGRLMCCLRYESEAYKDFKSRAPKVGTIVSTPAGDAKVVELNTPKELVRVRMVEGDENFYVPLEGMEKDPEKDTPKPTVVREDAFLECAPSSLVKDKGFEVPVEELLASEEASKSKRRRRRGGKKGEAANAEEQGHRKDSEGGKQKSRRKKGSGGGNASSGEGGGKPRQQRSKGGNGEHKQRPGQHSSNIQNPNDGQSAGKGGNGSGSKQGSGSRRRRRGGGQNHAHEGAQAQHTQHGQHQSKGGQQPGGGNAGSGNRSKSRRPRRTSGGQSGQGGQPKAE